MSEFKAFEGETTIGVRNKTTGIQIMFMKNNEKFSITKNMKKGEEDSPFCIFQGTAKQLEEIIEKSRRYEKMMYANEKPLKALEIIY